MRDAPVNSKPGVVAATSDAAVVRRYAVFRSRVQLNLATSRVDWRVRIT
jgi:hypothetical protein